MKKKEKNEQQDGRRPLLRGKELAYELQRRQWQRQLLGHLYSGRVHHADSDR